MNLRAHESLLEIFMPFSYILLVIWDRLFLLTSRELDTVLKLNIIGLFFQADQTKCLQLKSSGIVFFWKEAAQNITNSE